MPGTEPTDLPEFHPRGKMRADDMMRLREQLIATSAFNRGAGQRTLMMHGRTYTLPDPTTAASTVLPTLWIVRFKLSTVLPTNPYSAICFPLSIPPGTTKSQIPGLQPLGTITVCDSNCTFFNEPSGNLINRLGWAAYMQPLGTTVCQPVYYDVVPQWEVFELSCGGNPACN